MSPGAMAWQRCGRHLIPRSNVAALAPSILFQPRALPESLHQRRRCVHNRLQSAWDAAKGNAARVPSLLPLRRARGEMSFCAKFTTAVVLGSMTVGGVAIYDDYLIFQQVSKKALAKANMDPEFRAVVGENVDQGHWYEASMTVDHEGHSAMCSFPVSGTLCSANIHLRAVRYEETNSFASYFVLPGAGEWELVVLEALMHRPASGDQQSLERIDLLRSDEAAPGCAR